MAKSARASVTKANRTKFRQNITGPGELARAQRLSAKLLEVAAKPKPAQDEKMTDAVEASVKSTVQAKEKPEAMEIENSDNKKNTASKSTSKSTGRVQKKRRGKERNQIAFKSADRSGRTTRKGRK